MRDMLGTARGQSEVLGVVLLLGVVMLSIGTIFYTGGGDFEAAKQGIGIEIAEHELKKLAGGIKDVAVGDSPVKTVQLELEDGQTAGATTINGGTGQISVSVGGSNIYSGYLGTVRFEQGTAAVAYQGGGVFRKYPSGGAGIAQVPGWSENNYSSPTLTIPLIVVEGSGSPGTAVEVTDVNSQDKYPDKYVAASDTVTVTITSEFYEAWALFFRDHLGIPEEDVTVDDSTNTVTMTYGEGEEAYFHFTVYRVSVDPQ